MRTRSKCAAIGMAAALCFLWLGWEAAKGQTAALDEAGRGAIHSLAHPALTGIVRAVTLLGSQIVVLGVSGCAMAALFWMGRKRSGWLIAVAVGGADLLSTILKMAFHRPRPLPFFDTIAPGSYSYPSGHALLSLCCYGVLAWLGSAPLRQGARWLAGIAAGLLILTIGLSRVYLGVHYPSDVIGGYLAGTAWLGAVFAVWRRVE